MVKEFAEYFSLTIWDWFTAIVAVISLIVAVFAFVIAIKTYRVSKKTLASQQQTEKNTTPVINLKIQELILNKMIENLYFDRMELMAIWTLLMRYSCFASFSAKAFSNCSMSQAFCSSMLRWLLSNSKASSA